MIASARFVFTAYLSSLMPDTGEPVKIYVGAAADIFALQEPTFKPVWHLIISCVTSPLVAGPPNSHLIPGAHS